MIWLRRGRAGARARHASAPIALALMLAAATPASASEPATAAASNAVASEAVGQDPGAVREYWTPSRMRAAEPAGLALSAAGRIARLPLGAARSAAPSRIPAPRAAAEDASADNAAFPERIHGKVFFTINGGTQPGNYVCSGTVVTANNHALAWTAGHCVNDSEFGGGFATNWTFVPGFRNGERPFGNWPARELFTTRGWRDEINIRLDFGAAVLARDDAGRGIEDVLGARGIAFNQELNQEFTAFGYPAIPNPIALPPRFEFDGQRLWRCVSPLTGTDNPPGTGPATSQIDCDMTGGSSGGGWVIDGGFVNGLISYGYTDDGNHLYGPYFGSVAEDLYEDASGPPISCAKREVTNLGGPGTDDFTGTDGNDAFRLRGGDDRATADSGNDSACGGGGGDRLTGGPGRDKLRGGGGADRLIGGPGRDLCVGGPGRDRASGCEQEKGIP